MHLALLSLVVQYGAALKFTDLKPRNVNSIRHGNFAVFWEQGTVRKLFKIRIITDELDEQLQMHKNF